MLSLTKIKVRANGIALISHPEKSPINYLSDAFHLTWTKTQHANLALMPDCTFLVPKKARGALQDAPCTGM